MMIKRNLSDKIHLLSSGKTGLSAVLLTVFIALSVSNLFGQNSTAQSLIGEVNFSTSCSERAQSHFESGLANLHHMMYSRARAEFKNAVEADSECAMAHWGVAMTGFQPLWAPASEEDMELGRKFSKQAEEIGSAIPKERAFIAAVRSFFSDPAPPATDRPSDHKARILNWYQAQKELHQKYPADVEVTVFYALSEIAVAMTEFSPDGERDFTRVKRAGKLLADLIDEYPTHPGLIHYTIHAYDSPELAQLAEEAAKMYDQIAPDTPHALHMPSHIFVRLGNWENTADWNERSAASALRHPYNGITSMHYPHALDYVMYAYLQLENDEKADKTLERVRAIEEVQPHFGSAYGIAAPQARYYLEQKLWEEARNLEPDSPSSLNWNNYPAAQAIFRFARGLGAARTGHLNQAKEESEIIKSYVNQLQKSGDSYWSHMTEPLAMAIDAWVLYEQGEIEKAVNLLKKAAEQEEAMDKHPISPGEIYPVRELLAEMFLDAGDQQNAVAAFEKSLERTPNRTNARSGIDQIVNN